MPRPRKGLVFVDHEVSSNLHVSHKFYDGKHRYVSYLKYGLHKIILFYLFELGFKETNKQTKLFAF